ncbi:MULTISPECIES: tetratricopeptide repeat protein [Psychrilyobacter]|uniref:Tetratricopeptide repeat protein n=1 Tax=Psychrilyobacter piezotolerans TaxID=2293438 RepID=A0ABX9KET9_9FUSO|nr:MULTISPECIES: tetratricopeptide repeat protein [Psychrilyobacter]MCS5420826.1 tetratricopeptide repeat protein [Psychrilyobacter sp. S5]NDI79130.1 tetratricopeptide repeat protein [Psychrilyobacter piezotolerans]RDE59773.1 tetratricopeptide repeat protein [Psychrilyobacter sp. S5]REI40099.1 tetratricopeptide repeat protein [Psychrilyobacter piezotolerans]
MENKIFEIAKIHKITLKELGCKGISATYLTKIKKGHNALKEKHIPLLVDSFNEIFQEKNIDKVITIEDLYITPQQELDQLVNESLINKSIYSKEKQEEIENFERDKEVHSCKYRYIIAKHKQKTGREEEALKGYYDLLNNFSCSALFYSVLIEIIRLEKIELTYDIYLRYKKKIDTAPYKTKAILVYNTGVNLFETQKWKKAISCFEIVINMQEITKDYYRSYNNLGICYQNLDEYEKAIEYFKKSVSDPVNYHELEICYTNIISCAKRMKNEMLIKVTINKLENILKELKSEILYQTYRNIGLTYLYLGEKTKAIDAFEKEISFPIDLNHYHFNPIKYLDSIKQLALLYGNQPLKQQELIKIICKIPKKMICYDFLHIY